MKKMENSPEDLLFHVRYHLDRVAKRVLEKKRADYIMDPFTADRKLCDDLIREYERLRRENTFVWILIGVIFLLTLIMYCKYKL